MVKSLRPLGRRAWTVAANVVSVLVAVVAVATSRRVRRWLPRLALVAVLVPVLLQWLLAYVVGRDTRLWPVQLQAAAAAGAAAAATITTPQKNLMIVTAHPDDECLFFAPSILGVLDRSHHAVQGALLSISTGNNEGLGELRTKELVNSCAALGINSARCFALDHPQLQDNPRAWWDTELVASLVRDHVQKWEIDVIITFDAGGVSGHINHRAVSAAVSHYVNTDPTAPEAYMVVTVPLWRKYTFLGDLPLTALRFGWRIAAALVWPARPQTADVAASASASAPVAGSALVANTWHRYQITRTAFRQHGSQYSWDRHLYMVLSRYVWFNDLERARKSWAVPKKSPPPTTS
ncbi:N-acetylglucosaminyl phosphatidylinositol deacetylase [Niveomyces insectorum RCEF 264]|uniref:N-acetylglucosaminylphosphatidylinositol deacetylase n=1 Tax=Niveomyces insectorum RCEF 264 TaxID=1081102 RepID=A0A167VM18_9HYPO|nr:N-acetylglucosaminyl phosphatidylinositol deacetylase [Niveomyces insectorum RCEF 264]